MPQTLQLPPAPLLQKFPSTRYMGSKVKLLGAIWESVSGLRFHSVLDAFSGSGSVGYMFKTHGKQVDTNDILRYAYTIAQATIENSTQTLSDDDVKILMQTPVKTDGFIRDTFADLYFTDAEYVFLEQVIHRLPLLKNKHKRALALASLCRACVKKRPRGIFTFVGHRYDDGRKDLQLTLKQQFLAAIDAFNGAVFHNGEKHHAHCGDIFGIERTDYDLVYIDPPYFSTRSDNDYQRRYHFVEGLCSYWKEGEIDYTTKTRKLKKQPTRFDSKDAVYTAFRELFTLFPKSTFVVSYSSNSLPTRSEMLAMLRERRRKVEVVDIAYKYSFGNQKHKVGDNKNDATEYLFVAQ